MRSRPVEKPDDRRVSSFLLIGSHFLLLTYLSINLILKLPTLKYLVENWGIFEFDSFNFYYLVAVFPISLGLVTVSITLLGIWTFRNRKFKVREWLPLGLVLLNIFSTFVFHPGLRAKFAFAVSIIKDSFVDLLTITVCFILMILQIRTVTIQKD